MAGQITRTRGRPRSLSPDTNAATVQALDRGLLVQGRQPVGRLAARGGRVEPIQRPEPLRGQDLAQEVSSDAAGPVADQRLGSRTAK